MCLHAEKKRKGILSPFSFETDKAQREKPFSYNFCAVFALMFKAIFLFQKEQEISILFCSVLFLYYSVVCVPLSFAPA